jgi:hypothetical protein
MSLCRRLSSRCATGTGLGETLARPCNITHTAVPVVLTAPHPGRRSGGLAGGWSTPSLLSAELRT